MGMIAEWLQARSKNLRRRYFRDIEYFLGKNATRNDDEFMEVLYSFIYGRQRPEPQQQIPPNSIQRQKKRVDELRALL